MDSGHVDGGHCPMDRVDRVRPCGLIRTVRQDRWSPTMWSDEDCGHCPMDKMDGVRPCGWWPLPNGPGRWSPAIWPDEDSGHCPMGRIDGVKPSGLMRIVAMAQ